MWEFLDILLAIVIAVWLLDRELPGRRGRGTPRRR